MKLGEGTEIIKNWVEIVAIVAAGIWAYFVFFNKESPDLHKATLVETVISLDSLDNETLLMNVMSKFTNKGEKMVSIDSGEVAYWLVPLDSVTIKPYFSTDDYMYLNLPVLTYSFESLNGDYTSGQDYSQYFDFTIKKDTRTGVIVRTKLYPKKDTRFTGNITPLYSYDYKFHCIQDKTKE